MGRIGIPELLIILLILVVLFGATKIPQLGRGLGEGIRNFRKGLRGGEGEGDAEGDAADRPRETR
jgi:sec-independent protein translocase protein TatA